MKNVGNLQAIGYVQKMEILMGNIEIQSVPITV